MKRRIPILFNGSMPTAIVELDGQTASVSLTDWDLFDHLFPDNRAPSRHLAKYEGVLFKRWRSFRYIRAFDGGNTCLLQLAPLTYLYVGGPEIYRFCVKRGEEIVGYRSPMRRSMVPYPYATGKSGSIYLLLDKNELAPPLGKNGNDPYHWTGERDGMRGVRVLRGDM
jgi:hypothetical protein